MAVYLLVTLDTKGPEADFVRRRLASQAIEVRVVDTGCLGEPNFAGDITREKVFDCFVQCHRRTVTAASIWPGLRLACDGADGFSMMSLDFP